MRDYRKELTEAWILATKGKGQYAVHFRIGKNIWDYFNADARPIEPNELEGLLTVPHCNVELDTTLDPDTFETDHGSTNK